MNTAAQPQGKNKIHIHVYMLVRYSRRRQEIDKGDELIRLRDNTRLLTGSLTPKIDDATAIGQSGQVAEQLFERSGVLKEEALLAKVQNQNLGRCDLKLQKKNLGCVPELANLSRPSGNPYFTTETNLKQENYVIETVSSFRGLLPEIRSDRKPFSGLFNRFGDHTAQREAIETILKSKSPFVLFHGVAGAGKTSTLKELCECLKAGGGGNIHLVAPVNSPER